MENFALWIIFVAACAAIGQCFKNLSNESKAWRNSTASLRTELDDLREKLTDLTDNIESLTLTPTELEEKHFNRLPALASDQFVPLVPGDKLALVLDGFGAFHSVEYVHEKLIYRTPGEKDAVAYGRARLDASGEMGEVRILFSRPNGTATLRGIGSDGHVKKGGLLPNNSFKPNQLRGRLIQALD